MEKNKLKIKYLLICLCALMCFSIVFAEDGNENTEQKIDNNIQVDEKNEETKEIEIKLFENELSEEDLALAPEKSENIFDLPKLNLEGLDLSVEYVYGLEITSHFNGDNIGKVKYAIYDKDEKLVNQANGKEGIVETNEEGKAYLFLFADQEYRIKQIAEVDKYIVDEKKLEFNENDATLVKADEFSTIKIDTYAKIVVNNGLNRKEELIQQKTEEEKGKIEVIEKNLLEEVEEIFSEIDLTKYNNEEKERLNKIKESEITKVTSTMDRYKQEAEKNIREKNNIEYEYSFGNYIEALESVEQHIIHWGIIGLIVISLVLHFIFNKHILIDMLLLGGGAILYFDFCSYSIMFLAAMAIIDLIFTFIGLKYDNNIEDVEEVLEDVGK